MVLVGIDIGKNKHTFSIIDKGTGEILLNPSVFDNNQTGFLYLIKKTKQLCQAGTSYRNGRYRALPFCSAQISS